MSSIDERIVVLKFDNKQFESNTKQSIATLEKLNKSLQLDGAAKSFSGLQAATAKGIQLGGLSDAVDKVNQRFSALGIVGKRILENITDAAMRAGKNLVSNLISPIASGGLTRALNLEQAQFQIEGLGESWAKVKEDVLYGVKDTAYGLDEAAKVASQLLASQIKTGDEMKSSLRAISGVAAMTSSSYSDIGNIFTTVAGRGKLMTEQLNQLAHRGLNGAASLATFFNKVNAGTANASDEVKKYVKDLTGGLNTTEGDIRDMVTKGVINFEVFSAAMDDAFGEHAKKANETFTGSLSNMKAALARIGADVASPGLVALRDVFNAMTPAIDRAHDALQPLLDTLGKVFGVISAKIVERLNKMDFTWLRKLSEGASKGLSKIFKLNETYDKTVGNVNDKKVDASKIEKVADALKMVTEEESKAAWDIWIQGIHGVGEERKRSLEKAGLSYKNVQGYVNALYDANFDLDKVQIKVGESGKAAQEEIIKAQKESIATAKAQIEALTPMQKVLLGFRNIGETFKSIGKSIAGVFKAIGSAFKSVFSADDFANAFLAITGGVRKIVTAFELTEERSENLKKAFAGLFTILRELLKIVGKVAGVFTDVLAKAIKFAIDGLLNAAGAIGEFITNAKEASKESERFQRTTAAFKGVGQTVANAFAALVENIKQFFIAVHNTEGAKKFREELYNIWLIIKEKVLFIFDKLLGGMEKIGNKKFKVDGFKSFAEIIGAVLGKIGDFLHNLRTGEGTVGRFFKAFTTTSAENFKSFFGFLRQRAADLGEFFSKLSLFEKFKHVAGGIVEFFKNVFANIDYGAIGAAFKGFYNKLKEVFEKIDWEKLSKTIFDIVKIMAALKMVKAITGVADAVKGFLGSASEMFTSISGLAKAAKTRVKVGTFKALAAAVLMLVGAIWIVSTIPAEKLARSVGVVMGILWSLVGMIKLIESMKGGLRSIAGMGAAFAGMGAAMLMIVGAMKIIAGMSKADLNQALGTVTLLMIMMKLAASGRGATAGAGAAFAGMALAIDLLVPALWILSKMKWKTITKGAAAIGLIMLELSLASKLAASSKGGALSMLAMALAVDMMLPPLIALAAFPMSKTITAAASLAGIMLALAFSTKIASQQEGGAKKMLAFAIPIAAAGITLAVLAGMDFKNIIASAAGIAGVMFAAAAAVKIADGASGGVKSILAVVVPMVVAAVSLKILDGMSFENIIASAAGIAGVMVAAAGAVRLAGNVNSAGGVIAIISVIAAMGVLFYAISKMDVGDHILEICTGIAEVLVAIGGTIYLLNKGNISEMSLTGALKSIGILDLFIANLVGVLAALGGLRNLVGPQRFDNLMESGGEVFKAIGAAIGGFVGAIIGGIAEGVTSRMPKMGENLSKFAENVQPFIKAMADVDDRVLGGVEAVVKAVLGITAAEIIDSIGRWLTGGTDMASFGQKLVDFGVYLIRFGRQMAMTDTEALYNGAKAAEAIGNFAAALPKRGGAIDGWLGTNDLATFGEELWNFGIFFRRYAVVIARVPDWDAVSKSAEVGKAIASFADAIPNQGKSVLRALAGDNTLSIFGEELWNFGIYFRRYAVVIARVPDWEAVAKSAEVGKAVASFASEIPNQGISVLSVLAGDNTLSTFGEELWNFGIYFRRYATTIGRISEEGWAAIEKSAVVASSLTAFADGIPNIGGLVSLFTGENTMSVFGLDLASFGEFFLKYAKTMAKISNWEAVEKSALIAPMLAKFAELAPHHGGLVQLFTGEQSLAVFGAELALFGEGFRLYAQHVRNIDTDRVVEVSKAAVKAVDGFTDIDYESPSFKSFFTGRDSLKTLGSDLAEFGEGFAEYASNISGISPETVNLSNNIATAANRILGVAGNIANYDSTLLSDFSEHVMEYGSDLSDYSGYIQNFDIEKSGAVVQACYKIINLIKHITKVDPNKLVEFGKKLKESGNHGVDGFIKAFDDGHNKARRAIQNFIDDSGSGLKSRSLYGDMKWVGEEAAAGFIDGLYRHGTEAYNAGWYLGDEALTGIMNALDVHSPSKEFEWVGRMSDQGLINGLAQLQNGVYKAGEQVGLEALDAVMSPLQHLSQLVDEATEMQPVITPVLDLNNLEQGITYMTSLLGGGYTNSLMDITGNRAMNLMAHVETDPTSNKDVVDAVNLLRADLGMFTESMQNLSIMLDGRTLVGQLAPNMDQELGRLAGYQERGVR